ncbi:hypothetical protein CVIRNUC_000219 [Coccomyxa viridis]|uniref:C2H2-type domain-containing protein n=1 Tax=Coccomyxa viridis TaxID=1274662 RepID=A0AAV1HS56_9CHLO|nr:hypothetical protein CVIRNUC_000219 [Coccomyxa viridis]
MDPLQRQHCCLQRFTMDLNQYRKRKLAARHANDPPKPYACDMCHKTFAYIESVKCHAKQSHGCRDADFIRLGRNAPAQPLIGHPHHVMQPQSRSMCHSGLGNGLDPASFEAPDLPECCQSAAIQQARPQNSMAPHHVASVGTMNSYAEQIELAWRQLSSRAQAEAH